MVDAWSTSNLTSFLGVTAHYVVHEAKSGQLVLQSGLLTFWHIKGSHTVENLAQILFEIFSETGIVNHVSNVHFCQQESHLSDHFTRLVRSQLTMPQTTIQWCGILKNGSKLPISHSINMETMFCAVTLLSTFPPLTWDKQVCPACNQSCCTSSLCNAEEWLECWWAVPVGERCRSHRENVASDAPSRWRCGRGVLWCACGWHHWDCKKIGDCLQSLGSVMRRFWTNNTKWQ